MPRKIRDYEREYEIYGGTDKQKKRRALRNKARRKMIRLGRVEKGDGKDIAHKDNNPNNTSLDNFGVQSRHTNRSFPRNKKSGHKHRE